MPCRGVGLGREEERGVAAVLGKAGKEDLTEEENGGEELPGSPSFFFFFNNLCVCVAASNLHPFCCHSAPGRPGRPCLRPPIGPSLLFPEG